MRSGAGTAASGYIGGFALVVSAAVSAEDHLARGAFWLAVPLVVTILGISLIAWPTSPGPWAFASLFFAAGFGYNVALALAGWAECGCLGPFSLPPKWMATLDLAVCAATSLLAWTLRKDTPRRRTSAGRLVAGFTGAIIVGLLARYCVPVRQAVLFIPQRVDLGLVYYDETGTERIIAYNRTNEPLTVLLRPGCPCVSTDPSILELPPHEGVPLLVELDPKRARQPPGTTVEVSVVAHSGALRREGGFLVRALLRTEPARQTGPRSDRRNALTSGGTQ